MKQSTFTIVVLCGNYSASFTPQRRWPLVYNVLILAYVAYIVITTTVFAARILLLRNQLMLV